MKLKKLVSVCLLFTVALLSLAGCRNEADITEPAQTAVTEPFTQRGENAIRRLSMPDLPDFKRFSADPQYLSLGGGKLLTAHFDDGKFENTCVEICDLRTGKFTQTAVLNGAMTLCRALEDGNVLLFTSDGEYCVLSLDTGKTEKLDVPCPFGIFGSDMNTYYYVKEHLLYRANLKSGESEIIKNEYNMYLELLDGVYTSKDLLRVLAYPCDYDESKQCNAIIDPVDGKVLCLSDFMLGSCSGDSFYGALNAGTNSQAICCGSFGGSGEAKKIPILEPGDEEQPNLQFVNGTNYVFVQRYGDRESVELWQLGDTVKKCSLFACGIDGTVEKSVFIPEENLIAASVCDSQADTYSTVLIDLSKLKFTDGGEMKTVEKDFLIDKSLVFEESEQCPEELKDVREHADKLEEKYGVRILFGVDCCEFFKTAFFQTSECSAPDFIEKALVDMEKAFKLYPDGFLRQFNDALGNSGIVFMLSGRIEGDNGGYTEQRVGKNYIVVDISDYGSSHMAYYAFCHELWHATENFITDKNPDAFDDEKWNALNPEGFEYCSSYDENAWRFLKKWVRSAEKPENTYFVESYGRSFACEDRATIMEEVMTGEYGIEEMTECEHLNAKLRFMAEAVRLAFDTADWGTPRWEEPLSQPLNAAA